MSCETSLRNVGRKRRCGRAPTTISAACSSAATWASRSAGSPVSIRDCARPRTVQGSACHRFAPPSSACLHRLPRHLSSWAIDHMHEHPKVELRDETGDTAPLVTASIRRTESPDSPRTDGAQPEANAETGAGDARNYTEPPIAGLRGNGHPGDEAGVSVKPATLTKALNSQGGFCHDASP
jgi:hypothetical protein